MTYAYVQDIPDATMETYDQITEKLGDERPVGLVVHLAGPTDDGIRLIDVWESEEAFRSFFDERLMPATAAVVDAGTAAPEMRIDVLDVQHRW